jgi:hypothetical protein
MHWFAPALRQRGDRRPRWLVALLALAVLLLPVHVLQARSLAPDTMPNIMAAQHDHGDCHHGKPSKADPAQHCAACGVCHVLDVVIVQFQLSRELPDQPTARPEPVRHGRSPQPDLHPPLS